MKRRIISFLFVLVILGVSVPVVNGYSYILYGNSHSYNRFLARDYAAEWIAKYNPSYANFTGNGGDCTNFVSQCLRAGGISFTGTSTNPTYNHWYYHNSSWGTGRTSSWTTAHNFREHFAEVNGVGAKRSYQFRKYSAFELVYNSSAWMDLFNNIAAGDVVQYTHFNTGQTHHSQIVHRKSYNENNSGEYKLSMAQHTPGEWKNLRQYLIDSRFSSANGSFTRWITVIRFNNSTTW